MTETRKAPQRTRQYQPPLPWNGDPGLAPARVGRPPAAAKSPSTTKSHQIAAESRHATGPTPTPRRAVAYGDWRLDEKTRRAGRQGVAAARAALAGATGPGERRRADAA
ncbi:MAG TPA: hypothetical protein VNC61_08860 [Acidimicrobiales bacterium]|nr:hypothetical protein [Acidimicrobiales bacterium]